MSKFVIKEVCKADSENPGIWYFVKRHPMSVEWAANKVYAKRFNTAEEAWAEVPLKKRNKGILVEEVD